MEAGPDGVTYNGQRHVPRIVEMHDPFHFREHPDHVRAEFMNLARIGHAGGIGQRQFGDSQFDEAAHDVLDLLDRNAALAQLNEVEIAPESTILFWAANSAQSANPSTMLTGVLLKFARQCASLAETVSFALVRPASNARCTPFMFGTNARYSTPSTSLHRHGTARRYRPSRHCLHKRADFDDLHARRDHCIGVAASARCSGSSFHSANRRATRLRRG